jgi:hypothetical protein
MDDCSCIYNPYEDNADLPGWYKTRYPTARVDHRCDECHRIIDAGEKYENTCGKWSHKFHYFTTCYDCVKARSIFYCEGWAYGEVWHGIREMIIENSCQVDWDEVARLSPHGLRLMISILEECYEEF